MPRSSINRGTGYEPTFYAITYTTTYTLTQASALGDSWSLLPHPARSQSTEYTEAELHYVTTTECSMKSKHYYEGIRW